MKHRGFFISLFLAVALGVGTVSAQERGDTGAQGSDGTAVLNSDSDAMEPQGSSSEKATAASAAAPDSGSEVAASMQTARISDSEETPGSGDTAVLNSDSDAMEPQGSSSEKATAASAAAPGIGDTAALNSDSDAMEPQSSGSEVLSLKDCMAYAISNSTKMRIRQAEKGDAQVARRDAILTAFTPEVNASTYAYYNFGRSIDPQTNTYFNTTSFHNSYSVSAGITLFDGFSAVNNIKISKTGLLIADSQQKQVEADICLAVMEAYYNVVYYSHLVDIYKEQVSAAELSLRKAQRQEELGQKGHADVVQMEADLADRQYDLITADAALLKVDTEGRKKNE